MGWVEESCYHNMGNGLDEVASQELTAAVWVYVKDECQCRRGGGEETLGDRPSWALMLTQMQASDLR